MNVKTFFLFLIMGLSISAWSQNEEFSWENQPAVIEDNDSLILYSGPNEGLYLEYELKDFQTLYRVAKFFGSDVEDVYKANQLQAGKPLPDGLQLRIPIDKKNVITDFWGRSLFKKYNQVYYKVAPKETQFHIARVLFDMDINTLKRRNKLNDTGLNKGQILKIGWFPEEGLFEPVTSREMEEDGYSWDQLELTFAKASDKGKISQQKGIAYWNNKQVGGEGLYVLHKNAEVNTYIEIINPMFGTKIYAKVIGRIPDNAYPSEVLAVISPAAAKELRARDARFFVKMRYLQPGSNALPASN